MYDFIDCFNSQRDGILHSFQCHRNWLWYVSIPNGMEFYKAKASQRFNLKCFNSQRDGILPMLRKFHFWQIRVSIPNGMEFY